MDGNQPIKNLKHKPLYKNAPFLLLLGLMLLARLFFVLALPQLKATASDLTIQNILSAVNRERSLRNLVTLNTDTRLSVAAQSKSQDMQTRHYFAHVDPDGNYIWPKIEAAGYTPYLQLGENLAIEFNDTDSLMAAWMDSPTHRENILNEGFKDQGMGIAMGDSSAGQYHSAVTNTFGALLIVKAHTTPSEPVAPVIQTPTKPQATTKPATTPKPTTTKPEPPAPVTTTPPAPVILPTSTPPVEAGTISPATSTEEITTTVTNQPPLQPRENNSGFALANLSKQTATTSVASETSATSAPTSENAATTVPITYTSPAVINTLTSSFSAGAVNQKIILGFGLLLLLLMIADIKVAAERNLAFLDKKINNLAVLIISLIVIAFMYWL